MSPDLSTSHAQRDRRSSEGESIAEPGACTPSAREAERRRALLAYGGPRDVLARIVDGDPLGLRPLLARRVRERCLLLDADRAHLRALALCARYAPRYRGRPGLDEWLRGLVDRALDELVGEEAERLEQPHTGRETSGAWVELARPLGIAPDDARRACARFNRLAVEVREAFVELVLERCPLDELVRRTCLGAPELARRARRALLAVLDTGAQGSGSEGPGTAQAQSGARAPLAGSRAGSTVSGLVDQHFAEVHHFEGNGSGGRDVPWRRSGNSVTEKQRQRAAGTAGTTREEARP